MMFESKQIELGGGWDRLGSALFKGLLYYASFFSIATAFLCWVFAAAKHGLKRIDVTASAVLWVSTCAAYYVFYVWWPTPEMLVLAASRNDIPRAAFCLGHGIDVDSIAPVVGDKDVNERTALTAALRKNHAAMVEFLIENGADPNHRDGNDDSPFESTWSWKTRERSWELGDRLLLAGADINTRGRNRLNSLEMLTSPEISPIG
jgi:hypothetical protein